MVAAPWRKALLAEGFPGTTVHYEEGKLQPIRVGSMFLFS
jgi:hypothetical protein